MVAPDIVADPIVRLDPAGTSPTGIQGQRNAELAGISAGKIVYKTSRGDLDNYSKALFDALNKIIWEDDSQIVDYHISLFLSLSSGL